MRKSVALIAATLVASLAAAPAAAQDGAIWRDDKGRQMVLGFAGGGSPPPAPKTWTAPDMVDLFNRLCIAGSGAPEIAKSEAIAAGLTDKSYDMPVSAKEPAWPLIIAEGQGVVLAQADKFLSNPLRQCNVTFYLPQQPDAVVVEQAFTALVGRIAANDSERTKKNGKPNKYFSPEWHFPAAADSSAPAFVATFSPIASGGTGIQFSFLAQKGKAK